MAEEGTLGIARASEHAPEEISKAELQRRMDEARDSISQTVTEIKDTVVHQYEAVKETINDTLDWREQFKKRPVAWSLGAAGSGFVVGYAIAAMVNGESGRDRGAYDYARAGSAGMVGAAAPAGFDPREPKRPTREKRHDEPSGPGLVERFQQTEAYEHVRKEAGQIGRQFVGELSQTAKEVILPAAVSWLKEWLAGLVSQTKTSADIPKQDVRIPERKLNHDPVLERTDD